MLKDAYAFDCLFVRFICSEYGIWANAIYLDTLQKMIKEESDWAENVIVV